MPDTNDLRHVRPWGGHGFMTLATTLAHWVPRRLGYPLAEGIGRMVGRCAPQWRAIVESNLAPVLEGATARQIRRVAVEVFAHFVRAYYELLYLPAVPLERVVDMVTIEGPGWQSFLETRRHGQGVILTSTHQSSFDLAGQALAARGFPSHVLALPEQINSLAVFQQFREAAGNRVLPLSHSAIREAMRALRGGGIVATAADRPVRGQGIEVELFGRPTVLPDGQVRLAMRTGVPIYGAFCSSEKRHYTLRFVRLEMVRSGDQDADVRENVQRIAHMIEPPIRAHPEQWHLFWRLWPQEETR